MPIMALEEKKRDNIKPMESKPFLGLFKKSSRKPISGELFFWPGMMSRINVYSSLMTSSEIGMCGINVKRKIIAGGMAMVKLNAIAEALSVIPTVFTCFRKNIHTSYKDTPRKPGNEICLLFSAMKLTGAELRIFFSMVSYRDIIFYWPNQAVWLMLPGKVLHISYGHHSHW